MNDLMPAIYGIGSLALLPAVFAIIGSLRAARRERRRQAMLARHAERLWS